MVSADVGRLMRHNPRQFSLFVGIQDQTRVDIEEATRQSKRIDLVRIQDLDRERDLAVGILHDVLADAIDILRDNRVCDEFGALFNLICVGLSHFDLGICGVPVSQALSTNFAVAHRGDVFDAAGLHLN